MKTSISGCRSRDGSRRPQARGPARAARGAGVALVLCGCALGAGAAEPAGGTGANRMPARPARQAGVFAQPAAPTPGQPAATAPTRARSERPPVYTESPLDRTAAFYKQYIDPYVAERLIVGLRLVNNKLKETSRPADRDGGRTFLGYINEIEQQEKSGVRPFVGYQFCPYFSVELSEDEVAARTRNYNNGMSDGVLRMSGPVFTATVRYPVTDYLSPYVGLGYAPWSASFDHDAWWRLGYSSPETYAALGSPDEALSMGRLIEVEGDSATFFTLGLAVRLHRRARLDVMMRQIDMTSKARFYHDFSGNKVLEREGEFTLKHSTYGVALGFVF